MASPFVKRRLLSNLLTRHTEAAVEQRRKMEVVLERELSEASGQSPRSEPRFSPIGPAAIGGDTESAPLIFRFSWRKLLSFAGPGWLMSLAYLDPGNLESDLQEGAYTGPTQIWVLWWSTVMGWGLQEGCARIGLATGNDLAQCVRAGYPRWVSRMLYVLMEIAVTASDVQEVVGSAIALKLLFGLPLWAGCLVTVCDTFTFLLVHKLGVRYLEAVICCLIGVVSICFFLSAFDALAVAHHVRYALTEVGRGWAVPKLEPWGLQQAVGTLGAVIMPHNLYLHSSLVLSRRAATDGAQQLHDAIQYSRIESGGALFFSFLINLAVVITFWRHFYREQCAALEGGPYVCVTTSSLAAGQQAHGACSARAEPAAPAVCTSIDLASAGEALGRAVGPAAQMVWAVGLLAAGQAATMTATFAGQMLMDGMISVNLPPWGRIAITRTLCMGPALLVAFSGAAEPTIFGPLNMALNVLQSLLLPFAMLPVLHFSTSAPLMGRFCVRGWPAAVTCFFAMLICAVNLLAVAPFLAEPSPYRNAYRAAGVLYTGLALRLVRDELCAMGRWAAEHALAYLRDTLDACGCAEATWPPRELRARLLPPQAQASPFGGGVPRSLTAESFEGAVEFKL